MDCTIFAWEVDGAPPQLPSDGGQERRKHLSTHLRFVYPLPLDDRFTDLVRALDSAAKPS